MKRFISVLLFTLATQAWAEIPGVLSGNLALEHRHFRSEGDYGNDDRSQLSLTFSPEYVYAWNEDRNVITFEPVWRRDSVDDGRSNFDVRELSYVASHHRLEWRLGVSKVFWGVTESQHLVDVINQTDAAANPDGENKLGQPMVSVALITDVGNLSAFILPYFRERTFPDAQGRYRGPRWVDVDHARFTSDQESHHVDYALRWSGYWRDLDWGVSWFRGTDRDPVFHLGRAEDSVIPMYGQARQFGIELQHISGDLLSKAELRYKETDLLDGHFSSTMGVEYSLYGMLGRADVGLLYEWLYDTRGSRTPTGMGNASFLGTRLAANDAASTQALMGAVIDHASGRLLSFRLEASRRFGSNFSLDVELNVIASPPDDNPLRFVEKDSYLQVTVNTFF